MQDVNVMSLALSKFGCSPLVVVLSRFSLSKNNDPNFVQIENSFDTFAPKFATVKEKKAYDTTREQARRL